MGDAATHEERFAEAEQAYQAGCEFLSLTRARWSNGGSWPLGQASQTLCASAPSGTSSWAVARRSRVAWRSR